MAESAEHPWVLVFNGRTVPATPGESVGAALTNAGIRSWRLTRKHGRPRGLFCGIGVCFDCLLSIDGLPNQRACLIPVAPGMKVDSGSSTEQALTDE
jgi:predicted molibdopterin-dependent oxidoreductase YjgC